MAVIVGTNRGEEVNIGATVELIRLDIHGVWLYKNASRPLLHIGDITGSQYWESGSFDGESGSYSFLRDRHLVPIRPPGTPEATDVPNELEVTA